MAGNFVTEEVRKFDEDFDSLQPSFVWIVKVKNQLRVHCYLCRTVVKEYPGFGYQRQQANGLELAAGNLRKHQEVPTHRGLWLKVGGPRYFAARDTVSTCGESTSGAASDHETAASEVDSQATDPAGGTGPPAGPPIGTLLRPIPISEDDEEPVAVRDRYILRSAARLRKRGAPIVSQRGGKLVQSCIVPAKRRGKYRLRLRKLRVDDDISEVAVGPDAAGADVQVPADVAFSPPVQNGDPPSDPRKTPRPKKDDGTTNGAETSSQASGAEVRPPKSASKARSAGPATPAATGTPGATAGAAAGPASGPGGETRGTPRANLFETLKNGGTEERTNHSGTNKKAAAVAPENPAHLSSKYLLGLAANELCVAGRKALVPMRPTPYALSWEVPVNVACCAVTRAMRGSLRETVRRYAKGQHFSLQVQRMRHHGKDIVVIALWLGVRPHALRFLLQWYDLNEFFRSAGEEVGASNERDLMVRVTQALLDEENLQGEYLLSVNVRLYSGLWSCYEGGVTEKKLQLVPLVPCVLDASDLLSWIPRRFEGILQILEELREICVHDRVVERFMAGHGLHIRFLPETNSWLYWGYVARVLQQLPEVYTDVCDFLETGGGAERSALARRLRAAETGVSVSCLQVLLQPLVHAMGVIRDAHDLRCVVSGVIDFINTVRGALQGGAAELLPMACWPAVLSSTGAVLPLMLPTGFLFAGFRDLELEVFNVPTSTILMEVQAALLELYGSWCLLWRNLLVSDVCRGALFPMLTLREVDLGMDEVQQWGGAYGTKNEALASEVLKLIPSAGEDAELRNLWLSSKIRTKTSLGSLMAPGLISWR